MADYVRKLWYILSGKKERIFILIAFFTLTSILEAFGIGLIGPFVNLISAPESINKFSLLKWIAVQLNLQSNNQIIATMSLSIVGLFCVKSFLLFCTQVYLFKFSFKQESVLSLRLLRNYLLAPYTFHLNRNSASLINNIISEVTRFTHSCLLPLLNIISSSVIIVIMLGLLAKTNLTLLVMILGILLPTFFVFHRLGDRFRQWGKVASESRRMMIRTINHSLGGLKEVRTIGCEPYFLNLMHQHVSESERALSLFYASQILPRILIETVLIVFLVLYLSVAQILFNQDIQNITALMGVFAFASIRLIPSSSQLIQAIAQLRNSGHTLNLIYSDLRELESQTIQEAKKYQLGGSKLKKLDFLEDSLDNRPFLSFESIRLQRITYHYPNTPEPAIKDISLKINRGESIALIGKSGSGKTTLVDIILGLLQPNAGDILIDHVSVYQDLLYWQSLIGYIPQSIFLMDDTVERNIAFGVPDHLIDKSKLKNAIRMAQLEELIEEQLPNGLETIVGERGVRLSGGQRQRIGIARALYHEREILVLDEATSALDNETEKLVSESIQSLAGQKTMIIIAHRLTTVQHCDRVYLLDRGEVVKSGSYQEVVEAQAAF